MPPRLAIVIPVWNDAAALAGCLDRLRAAGTPTAEIVIADASPDPDEQRRIEDLAARHGARLVRAAAPSRGAQLAAGAAAAHGEILVFSHADTALTGAHLDALLTRLEREPTLQGGAFHRDIPQFYPRLAWAAPVIRWWMAEVGTVYGDQSPFIRRDALHRLGGFPALPIMEDLAFSDLLRHGLARDECALLDPPLRTSTRRFRRRGPLLNKLHNLALTAAWRLGLASPEQIHRWYYHTGSEGRHPPPNPAPPAAPTAPAKIRRPPIDTPPTPPT
jgi:glycosyltransferase involved in cell wall biosynthesis